MLTFLLQSLNARAAMLIGLETILIVGSVGLGASSSVAEAWPHGHPMDS